MIEDKLRLEGSGGLNFCPELYGVHRRERAPGSRPNQEGVYIILRSFDFVHKKVGNIISKITALLKLCYE
jgi:hypothetical protein